MKSLFLSLLIITGFAASANTYYFAATGSDANNGTAATTPWQTIAKFNSVFASKSPGDIFLFHKGDSFYGSLIISRSGSAGNPITIGAYGSGAMPVVTGFTTINAWTNLGSNIWESTAAASTLSTLNMVVINGANTPMGRYPNTGYLTYQTGTSNTSITSSSLNSSSTNWTGATLYLFANSYSFNKGPITSASGATLNYTADPTVTIFNPKTPGFFIGNDARTLDTANEWYYNPSTKKIRIYQSGTPANVKIASIDTLAWINQHDFITFDGLSFQGANKYAIEIKTSKHVVVKNCDINYIGINGIDAGNNTHLTYPDLENNTINHCNNAGIDMQRSDSCIFIGNTVKNTGIIPGMGNTGAAVHYTAISTSGTSCTITDNIVDSAGYNGINFYNNTLVQRNFVNNTTLLLGEGGALYTFNGQPGPTMFGTKVLNNVVFGNGFSSLFYMGNPGLIYGIYLDGYSNNMEIAYNSESGFAWGMMLHENHDQYVHDNSMYNNTKNAIILLGDDTMHMPNITLKRNIFFAKNANEYTLWLQPPPAYGSNLLPNFVSDSNYWARPIDNNGTSFLTFTAAGVSTKRTPTMWQTYSSQDAHSLTTPINITNVNQLNYEYNGTSVAVVKSLPGGTWTDVKGVSYNTGSITLQPFTSAILINTGTNIPPAANAGTDKNITLPSSSVTQVGGGTGTIVSYNWTQVSGPAGATFGSGTSSTTAINGMNVAGTYLFQLKVTDNGGAISSDTVKITSNAANIAPTANAGADQSITLPASSVSLNGSGADADGTIAAYSWTKISGPSAGAITNAATAATTVTAMTQGVYQFQLKVTDNGGAISSDTIKITSNAAANIAPTANAGADQSITLPANSVSLNGSGADTDGTIAAYSWTMISGPSAGAITSAATATTTVTGLVQGVYLFGLKVTDNGGAISSDTVKITSNASANIAPTANAGADQSITLPANSVSLNGSGADTDGTISAYSWITISGPSAGTITNASSAATTVTAMVQGVYQFQLKVTDNSAATTFDTIQVTVNAAGNLLPAVNPANTVNGLAYKYYEGSNYSVVPDFSTLTPVKTGTARNFIISAAGTTTGFAFNFTGFITVPSDGQYTFYTTSDDGSKLYIDNVPVVNNDGLHGSVENSGTIGLKAGKHAITVGYFQQTGGSVLNVNYAGPGIAKRAVPASALYRYASQQSGFTVSMDASGFNQISSSPQVSVKAYPNPFVNNIEVSIAGGVAGEYKLVLADASGKTIWLKSGTKDAGAFQQSVSTSNLVSGIYFLKVIQNNTVSVVKLVK